MKRLLGNRDTRGIIRLLQERYRPTDVLAQQDKVKRANALAFIAPVYFVGFPAMLKGWIERVFTLGFAYDFTPAGWKGDLSGRVPRLTHEKALVMQTTIFVVFDFCGQKRRRPVWFVHVASGWPRRR